MAVSALGLERRLFQLETLYEIGRDCALATSVDEGLRIVLAAVSGAFGALGGIACVGEDGRFESLCWRGIDGARAAWLAGELVRVTQPVEGIDVVVPIALDGGRLRGALGLGPRLTGEPYAADDRALLRAIVTHALPYLENLRLVGELRQRVRALGLANEIALGMADRPSETRLHRFLLERLASELAVSDGALALRDGDGWRLVARLNDAAAPGEGEVLARVALPVDGDPCEAVASLVYGAEVVGALWLRRPARPFDSSERALLDFLATQGAALLDSSRSFEERLRQQQEQFRLRGVLEQYLAPSVAERLISGETRPLLEGVRVMATVLMVDMRGSSELTNLVGPEEMVRLLNQYFGQMTDAFFAHEGTIDKFEGDALIGFFGAPERHDDDPLRALRTGAQMQRAFDELRADWASQQPIPDSVGIGVGIATGEVVVGNIGSAKRIDHTVIGAAANLAARLASQAPAGRIQLDETTWRAIAPALGTSAARRRPWQLRAKGFGGRVPVYRLRAADVPG